jgi:hypothetical protein
LPEPAPFHAWPAHLSLPVWPAHHVQRICQYDPATPCLLAQRRVTAIDRSIKDRVLAVLAKRDVSHDRKGHAPDDRVRLRVFDHCALLPRSALCGAPFSGQLGQATNHLLGPRIGHLVQALEV